MILHNFLRTKAWEQLHIWCRTIHSTLHLEAFTPLLPHDLYVLAFILLNAAQKLRRGALYTLKFDLYSSNMQCRQNTGKDTQLFGVQEMNDDQGQGLTSGLAE